MTFMLFEISRCHLYVSAQIPFQDHENQNREFNGEKKKLPPLDDSSTEEDL